MSLGCVVFVHPRSATGMLSVDVVDALKDNDVNDVESSTDAADQLMLIVEPHGLWLLLRNPSDVDVEQDDVVVGLFLTLSVGEVCMLAHHLVVVAAQLLTLSICTSPSSLL